MLALPLPSNKAIALAQGWIAANGSQELIQTQIVLHRQHKLIDQLTRLRPNNSRTENPIFTRNRNT